MVSPSTTSFPAGTNASVTITPLARYYLTSLQDNAQSIPPNSNLLVLSNGIYTYHLNNVTVNHALSASFSNQVNGVCGQAVHTYKYNATSFSGQLCSQGTSVPATVKFPAPGRSVHWICQGENGGQSSKTCTAKRSFRSLSRF